MFAADYYRPQWETRVTQPAAPAPGPSWHDRLDVGHVLCLAVGMIVGMVLMRWQHRGGG